MFVKEEIHVFIIFFFLTWFDHFHFSYFRFHICDSCRAFEIFFMISWLMPASLSRYSLAPLTWFSRFSNFSNNVCLWPQFFYKFNWLTWLRKTRYKSGWRTDLYLEPVCCKIVPNQLLVWGVGDLWRTWRIPNWF